MLVALWETLYIIDVVLFSGLIGYLLFASYPRRRGPYEVYEAPGVLIINEATGEVTEVRPVRLADLDARPKCLVQCHYAEDLAESAWSGRQDVVAEIEVSDCGVLALGTARTKVVHGAGRSPRWHATGANGLVTIVLPATRLDLSRLAVTIRLYAVRSLAKDKLLGTVDVGTLADVGHGNPLDRRVAPRGTLVLGVAVQNVGDAAHCFPADVPPPAASSARPSDLPVAVARPL